MMHLPPDSSAPVTTQPPGASGPTPYTTGPPPAATQGETFLPDIQSSQRQALIRGPRDFRRASACRLTPQPRGGHRRTGDRPAARVVAASNAPQGGGSNGPDQRR